MGNIELYSSTQMLGNILSSEQKQPTEHQVELDPHVTHVQEGKARSSLRQRGTCRFHGGIKKIRIKINNISMPYFKNTKINAKML